MRHGLGASSASMKALIEGLDSAEFYLISSLGVVRSIRKSCRYIPSEFCGMRLYCLTTETAAANLNTLLQHYGTSNQMGVTIQASLEHLHVELGVLDCPFLYDYTKWGHLTTNLWVKALWEKVSTLQLNLRLNYRGLPPTRDAAC